MGHVGAFMRDAAAAVIVLIALALPILPRVVDGAARMHVHFRTGDMEAPRVFTTDTSRDVCAVMAVALAFEDSETGDFTRVACAD
ncbi:MAG TPA: hypothetical protein VET85_05745 [Stellaceae bacterium]|nr:hypothetical protein [Stellaceae bacterium]